LSDIVDRLRDLVIDNPLGSNRMGVSADITVRDLVRAIGEIVRLRAERDEAIAFRNDMQAAGHAISQGAQAAHDIWRKEQALRKAAEAERDRLRDALRYLHETVDRAFPALSTTPPMVEARAALGDKP
jgi:hypothetical protein